MRPTLECDVRLLHAIPGRVRLHLPSWLGAERERVAAQLRAITGVHRAQFNALTDSLLVQVDPSRLSTFSVVALVQRLVWDEAVPRDGGTALDATSQIEPSRADRCSPALPAGWTAGAMREPAAGRKAVPYGLLLNLGRVLVRLLIGPTSTPRRPAGVWGPSAPRLRPVTGQHVRTVLRAGALELAIEGITGLLRLALPGYGVGALQLVGFVLKLSLA